MNSTPEGSKYNQACNKLVLFLFERLLDKNGSRQLAGLIGTLGHQDCTPEMRHIVAGPLYKLKKFITDYPTLFVIDGGIVSINTSGNNNGDGTDMDEATMEAIDYFSEKIAYYGKDAMVPIRVLLGHQSLAGPRIGKASGQNPQEFLMFFLKHANNFVLSERNDTVSLKDYNIFKSSMRKAHLNTASNCDTEVVDTLLNFFTKYVGLKGSSYVRLRSRINNTTLGISLNNKKQSTEQNHPSLESSTNAKMINTVKKCETFAKEIWNKTQHNDITNKKHPIEQDYTSLESSTNVKIINTVQKCEMFTKEIWNKIQHDTTTNKSEWPFTSDKVVIGLDCQGVNLKAMGEVTLIEIATVGGQVYIFDIKECPKIIDAGLKQILESPNVIKIMHECRTDSASLFKHLKVILRNVFDTLVAYRVLSYQSSGKSVYQGRKATLSSIYYTYNVPVNLTNYQGAWTARPLTREMVVHASARVIGLVHQHIYPDMCNKILPENRQLMLELCDEQIFWQITPNAAEMKQGQRKSEIEIAELHAKLVQCDYNMVLSNKQLRHLRLIQISDEKKNKLVSLSKAAKISDYDTIDKCSLGAEEDNEESINANNDIVLTNNNEPTTLTEYTSYDTMLLNNGRMRQPKQQDQMLALPDSVIIDPFSGSACRCSNCCKNMI